MSSHSLKSMTYQTQASGAAGLDSITGVNIKLMRGDFLMRLLTFRHFFLTAAALVFTNEG